MKTRVLAFSALAVAALLAACDQPDSTTASTTTVTTALPPPAADTNTPAVVPMAQPQAPGTPVAQSAEDQALSRKVKETLEARRSENAAAIPSARVEVAADGGVVTLYGTVAAASEGERAALLAMGVEGVRSVVNNLTVVQGS